MEPDHWRALEPLLDAALDLPPEQRGAFVRGAAGIDDLARAELEQLLVDCERPEELLDCAARRWFPALLEAEDRALGSVPDVLADRFRMEREIGRGGTATVYLAHDLRHERDVAVKVLHPTLAAMVGADRFLAEIRVTANLRHPHIVPLFDSGEAGGQIYYVMPFVEGETLRERLDRGGSVPVPEAVQILRDISDAVAYAHAHGVVHRDLKPENVLLGAGGAVVSDFGIAKALVQSAPHFIPASSNGRGAARSSLIAGTPGYMSPEQLRGSPQVDAASDVYSLGVVGYEMLAGAPLFAADSPEDLRFAHLHQEPVALYQRCPSVPREVNAVIHRALAKSPGSRFATAAEFRSALDAPLRRASGRRRLLVRALGAAAALALVLTAGVVASKARATSVARQLLNAGIRASSGGDWVKASGLFRDALKADSTLAIAAMWAAETESDSATWATLMGTALAHAATAPVRERLHIRLHWARSSSDPTEVAIADSLRLLDPDNPDGYLELAKSRLVTSDFLLSIPLLRQAITLDSAGFAGPSADCLGCTAFDLLIWAYLSIDSLDAGERTAREWIARRPDSYNPWWALAWTSAHRGRAREALDALHRAAALNPTVESEEFRGVQIRMFLEDYAAADSLLAKPTEPGDENARADALWWRGISLRNQGRLHEALTVANQFASLPKVEAEIATVPRAVVLLEMGRARESRALFEGLTNPPLHGDAVLPSARARQQTWRLARTATAVAAMMDTAALKVIVDSVERIGRVSKMERDRRIHHYVRANVLVARGALAEASDEYRQAIERPTFGYTRINLELGRVLLALRRPEEAVSVVRAALDGHLESNNYYVTRTELHELLAMSFDAAGARDSAATHYEKVVKAWRGSDPEFAARVESARRHLAALRRSTAQRQ